MFLNTEDATEEPSDVTCNRCSREAVVAVADSMDDEMELLCASHDAQTVHDVKVYKDP